VGVRLSGFESPLRHHRYEMRRDPKGLRLLFLEWLRIGCGWLRFVQSVDSVPVAARDEMPKDIHGHLDTGMPQLFLNCSGKVYVRKPRFLGDGELLLRISIYVSDFFNLLISWNFTLRCGDQAVFVGAGGVFSWVACRNLVAAPTSTNRSSSAQECFGACAEAALAATPTTRTAIAGPSDEFVS